MRRLPRRLALWGGAAAIAGGGFAFMASNTTGASSAGEGVGAVSGYTVSGITYTITNVADTLGTLSGADHNAGVTYVTFTLTSQATTASANGQPKQVWAYVENSAGHPMTGHSHGPTQVGCPISGAGWHLNGNNQGYGQYTCTLTKQPVKTVSFLDIEASQ